MGAIFRTFLYEVSNFALSIAVCFLTSASMQIDSWYSGFLRRLRYDRSYGTSHAIGLRYFNSSHEPSVEAFAEPKLFRFNYLYFGKNELCVFVCAHIISFCLKSLHFKQQIHAWGVHRTGRHLEHKKKCFVLVSLQLFPRKRNVGGGFITLYFLFRDENIRNVSILLAREVDVIRPTLTWEELWDVS